jgi:hypothetical protein
MPGSVRLGMKWPYFTFDSRDSSIRESNDYGLSIRAEAGKEVFE